MKCVSSIFLLPMVVLLGVMVGGAGNVQAACKEYIDQNDYHVAEGRAYTKTETQGCQRVTVYYAVGSDDNLGTSGSEMTVLHTQNDRIFLAGECPVTITDSDHDGYPAGVDCRDYDSTIHPNATEICSDGIDQDCNGWDLRCPEGNCRIWTATNDEHVAAGRAYTYDPGGCDGYFEYRAVGSGDVMGATGDATTTLRTENGGIAYLLGDCPTPDTDADGDGYTYDVDCNDEDRYIHPGAHDICDDIIDQDCDGADQPC